MDIIEIEALRKSYGDHVVLDGIDLTVRQGSIFGLLGPNGAGKTTLITILTTLTSPDSGRATVAGFDVVREGGQVRRNITLTGQDAAVDDLLTGRENLVVMARLFGLSRRDARTRAAQLLADVQLTEHADRTVRTYSGGMRRRLDLAISVIPRPAVIFLDEPTTGLDPVSRRRVWASIRELAAAGTTIFLTTQYLEEADQLADRIAILDGGRLIAQGSADELKRRVGTDLVHLAFPDEATAVQARGRLAERGVEVELAGPNHPAGSADPADLADPGAAVEDAGAPERPAARTLTVRTAGDAAEIRDLLDHLGGLAAVAHLSLSSPSLDDAFLALTDPPGRSPAAEPGPRPDPARQFPVPSRDDSRQEVA